MRSKAMSSLCSLSKHMLFPDPNLFEVGHMKPNLRPTMCKGGVRTCLAKTLLLKWLNTSLFLCTWIGED